MFRSAIAGTHALPKDTSIPHANPRKELDKTIVNDETNLSDYWPQQVAAEDKLMFIRPGVQHKLIRQLRQGIVRQTAILDLHGKTVDEARDAVNIFLQYAKQRRCRCVRIIHGKGLRNKPNPPLLKNYVNGWLQQYPYVLAFCSTLPKDGGNGALYVLLKQGKDNADK